MVLVLDDFHLIREPAIHEDVAYFLERTPPGVHLAIASRAAPPVGVARLRVRGELGEVAEEELRFDRAGVGQLLNDGLGLTLADGDIDLLLERTEGWAAGLYLAGLSLQTRRDGAEFIASFSGAQRHLADYLLEEVLAGQPDELRRFLVQTSVLDRLTAPLCDALFETSGSRELLARIERSNLFLIPLDSHRDWFRYHHLFQDLLRLELERDVTAEEIRTLHGRAATWLAANDQIGEAIRHYLAAGQERAAADLIGQSWNRFLQRGEVASATRWLDALPAEAVLASPQLGLARSWVSLDVGDQGLAERWLDAATRAAADPDSAAGRRRQLRRVGPGDAARHALLPAGRPRDRAAERRDGRRPARATAARRGSRSRSRTWAARGTGRGTRRARVRPLPVLSSWRRPARTTWPSCARSACCR